MMLSMSHQSPSSAAAAPAPRQSQCLAPVRRLRPIGRTRLDGVGCRDPLRLRGGGHFDELLALRALVETENACTLPGCTIQYDRFVTILRRAMSRGYVKDHHGFYVLNGLHNGFEVGAQRDALRGRRAFRNYKSAYVGRESVSAAVNARVAAGKTLKMRR